MARLLLLAAGLAGLSSQAVINRNNLDFGGGQLLHFDRDGTFQISIYEDLHFGENQWDSWGPQQDINSVKVLEKVLDYDRPDLVVLNGDLITGDNSFLKNASVYVDKIVGPIVERNLPFASTYGNHDSHYNLSRDAILAREHLHKGALTRKMVFGREAGVSNYFLPVYPSNCRLWHCTPELILWFFDSRGGFYYQEKHPDGSLVGQPDWVDVSVVNWYQKTHAEISSLYGKTIPSLAFVHIPTYASQALQRKGVNANKEPGVNDDYLLAPQAQGWCENGTNPTDGSCPYGGQDIPFMKAITATPGLMAVFSGHDHGDTWCYKWDELLDGMTVHGNGINLCFGQHSGYGGYGNWIRGARQVLLSEKQLKDLAVNTWIRTEHGDKVGSVALNRTYGRDYYPATPNDMTHCPTCDYSIVSPMPGTKAKDKGPRKDLKWTRLIGF